MNNDMKPVLSALAHLALALEDFVTALVKHTGEMPDALVSVPQVEALMKRSNANAAETVITEQPQPEPQPEAIPSPCTDPISIEQIRKILAEKSQNGKQPAVKHLINQYGVRRLTDIDPSRYGELLKQAEVL